MAQDPHRDDALGPGAADLASAALALARRFAAGATLWCWAPHGTEHAQHIAVEFVHPVIMGARALSAVAVRADGTDVVASMRALVRPGDVVLVVGGMGTDGDVSDLVRRAPSWGATTIWIGAGVRPGIGRADHVLWVGPDAARASHDGRLVRAYHLLWELTHVCFEHPGLLHEGPNAVDSSPVCVTCADEGRVAEVVRAGARSATVRTAAGVEEIDTTLVGGLGPGDLVLVHAGTALTIVEDP